MILTLAIAVSTLSAFAAGEEEVSPKVLSAFKTEFSTAKEVKWTAGEDYYEATFVYNDKYLFAWYRADGELLGLSRFISPDDLPMSLQKSLKENYEGYWISDLFEVAKNDGTTYYVTLENADSKLVLRTSDTFGWNFHKKVKKA